MPKKSYIQKLFDQINGGDDVDAAEEAQEIAEELLEAAHAVIATMDSTGCSDDLTVVEVSRCENLIRAIAKAEGRK